MVAADNCQHFSFFSATFVRKMFGNVFTYFVVEPLLSTVSHRTRCIVRSCRVWIFLDRKSVDRSELWMFEVTEREREKGETKDFETRKNNKTRSLGGICIFQNTWFSTNSVPICSFSFFLTKIFSLWRQFSLTFVVVDVQNIFQLFENATKARVSWSNCCSNVPSKCRTQNAWY